MLYNRAPGFTLRRATRPTCKIACAVDAGDVKRAHDVINASAFEFALVEVEVN